MYYTPFDQYADDIYRRFNEQRRRAYAEQIEAGKAAAQATRDAINTAEAPTD